MSLVRDGVFDPRVVEHALGYRVRRSERPSLLPLTLPPPPQGITQKNYALLSDRITKATLPEGLRSLFAAFGSESSLAQQVDQIRMPVYGMLLVALMLADRGGMRSRAVSRRSSATGNVAAIPVVDDWWIGVMAQMA